MLHSCRSVFDKSLIDLKILGEVLLNSVYNIEVVKISNYVYSSYSTCLVNIQRRIRELHDKYTKTDYKC